MTVQVTSPDHYLTATVRGSDQISVSFRPGTYRGYTDAELAHQLAQLATLTWTAHRRECRRILRDEIDDLIEDDAIDSGPETRQYRERTEELFTEATSTNESIWVSTRALLSWDVTLGTGTVRYYSEPDFLSELDSVITRVLADHSRALILLKNEIYGIGVPDHLMHAAQ